MFKGDDVLTEVFFKEFLEILAIYSRYSNQGCYKCFARGNNTRTIENMKAALTHSHQRERIAPPKLFTRDYSY